MKEYDVTITETLEKTVTVEAASKAEAEEMVRQQYYNSEYILDSENFTGVDFKLVASVKSISISSPRWMCFW